MRTIDTTLAPQSRKNRRSSARFGGSSPKGLSPLLGYLRWRRSTLPRGIRSRAATSTSPYKCVRRRVARWLRARSMAGRSFPGRGRSGTRLLYICGPRYASIWVFLGPATREKKRTFARGTAFGAIRLLSRGAFDHGRLRCFCYNCLNGAAQRCEATYRSIRDLATRKYCQGLLM